MKNQNKPKHQTSKVENRDQQTDTRIQNFGCATYFHSRCVGVLEGGILPYAEGTGNRLFFFILGIVLPLNRLGAAENLSFWFSF